MRNTVPIQILELGSPPDGKSLLEAVKDLAADMVVNVEPLCGIVFTSKAGQVELGRILFTSELAKDAYAEYVTQAILGGAEEVVLLNEAWMVIRDREDDLVGTPSEQPDREEIVHLSYEANGKYEMYTAPIIRLNGKRSLGAWKLMETKESEGRLANLFQKAKERRTS